MAIGVTATPDHIAEGGVVRLEARPQGGNPAGHYNYTWTLDGGGSLVLLDPPDQQTGPVIHWDTTDLRPGGYKITVLGTLKSGITRIGDAQSPDRGDISITVEPRPVSRGDTVPVTLRRTATESTADQALWVAIRNRTQAISFDRYNAFIDCVLCEGISPQHGGAAAGENDERGIGSPPLWFRRFELGNRPTIYGVDAYNLLKLATEVFLLLEAGVVVTRGGKVTLLDPDLFEPFEESARLNEGAILPVIEDRLKQYFGGVTSNLPYLTRILDALLGLDPAKRAERLPYCDVVLQRRFSCPTMIELIWSYWHEEGMLVQTLKAIELRFQNGRGPIDRDPLANLEIDPLRPLNNLLWGYIQNEYN